MHGVLALRRGAQHVPCFRIKVQQLMLNFSNESDAVFCGRAFAAWRKVVALDRVRLSRNQQVSRVILSETAAAAVARYPLQLAVDQVHTISSHR